MIYKIQLDLRKLDDIKRFSKADGIARLGAAKIIKAQIIVIEINKILAYKKLQFKKKAIRNVL